MKRLYISLSSQANDALTCIIYISHLLFSSSIKTAILSLKLNKCSILSPSSLFYRKPNHVLYLIWSSNYELSPHCSATVHLTDIMKLMEIAV